MTNASEALGKIDHLASITPYGESGNYWAVAKMGLLAFARNCIDAIGYDHKIEPVIELASRITDDASLIQASKVMSSAQSPLGIVIRDLLDDSIANRSAYLEEQSRCLDYSTTTKGK